MIAETKTYLLVVLCENGHFIGQVAFFLLLYYMNCVIW